MSNNQKSDWIDTKWRPVMGWVYIGICSFDFLIAPILWSILQATYNGSVTTQWDPITLRGAGLFHLAMGAVLGITSYGRTREKMANINDSYNMREEQVLENSTEIRANPMNSDISK